MQWSSRLSSTLVVALLLISAATPAEGRIPRVRVGLHVEHNSSNQPGVFVGLDDPAILSGRPRVTFSYSTTRLATATGSNGLVKDRFLIAGGWYFRPTKRLDPYVQVQIGYARFNRENKRIFALLDNDAPVLSVTAGLETRWLDERLGVFADVGASVISSSTVYPLVATLGVSYRLRGGRRP